MSVPYSLCTKVQTQRNIWKNQKRYRRDIEKIVHSKRRGNNRGRSICRPHTHVGEHTSIFKYSTIHGISQRKSSLMIFDRHANLKYKYRSSHFSCWIFNLHKFYLKTLYNFGDHFTIAKHFIYVYNINVSKNIVRRRFQWLKMLFANTIEYIS